MLGKTLGVVGAAGLISLGGAGIASASAPGWHIVKSVKTGMTGDFSVVVASGKKTGWAFDQTASGPVAWERTGASTWKKVALPATRDETVVSAVAASPSDVWAFADSITRAASRALHWNGRTWSVVKTFAAPVAGASIPAASDLWVFGHDYAPALGVWHYNGRTWARVSTNLTGGSALSASDVWAFSGTSVDHWNGRHWAGTSVKKLLPPVLQQGLNAPAVYSVLALSADSVYAVGNGRAQDAGGPIVVLHYNGHTWSRVADGANANGDGYGGSQVAADGSGGLWIPTWGSRGSLSYLLHYSDGKLTDAALPVNAVSVVVNSVSRVPGTTQTLAGGFTHTPYNPATGQVAVILQHG